MLAGQKQTIKSLRAKLNSSNSSPSPLRFTCPPWLQSTSTPVHVAGGSPSETQSASVDSSKSKTPASADNSFGVSHLHMHDAATTVAATTDDGTLKPSRPKRQLSFESTTTSNLVVSDAPPGTAIPASKKLCDDSHDFPSDEDDLVEVEMAKYFMPDLDPFDSSTNKGENTLASCGVTPDKDLSQPQVCISPVNILADAIGGKVPQDSAGTFATFSSVEGRGGNEALSDSLHCGN